MIKQLLYKVFSINLSFLVLFSTASFSVEKHFCGDVLIDASLFSEVEKCENESLKIEIEKITKKSCCVDTTVIVKGQNELIVKSFDELDLEHQLLVAYFYYSYANLFEVLSQQNIPHKDYSSPNLIFDKQVLNQVFLI